MTGLAALEEVIDISGIALSRAVESDHGDGVSVAGRGVRGLSGGLVLRGLVDGVTVAV